ncbi:MAG: GNAT family N-acetyltransferase [Oscillospiraceae bacterium]|nr:GNAT family N-acetyltransferase [Oscillospiraceae bacterium]
MTLKESIFKEEAEFPKLLADYEERKYGLLFYMEHNKDSYDGNHAFIYPENITNLGAVLDEITEFYINKGITPSIYHPHVENYFSDNQLVFEAHDYTVTHEAAHRVMLLSAENQIKTEKRLDVKVLTEWDERIACDILIPSSEPWEIEPIKGMIEHKGSYIFVGYLNDEAVVYTNIHVSKKGNTRFDYIVTSKAHREKGYASELLSFVVEYCKSNGFPVCWQWAGPSEHICYRAGFREAFNIPAGYANYKRKGKMR